MDITKKALALSKEQRAISVAEFFEKNRHLLGYNTLQKALLTIVREAVDNSLDACEQAEILPEIYIQIEDLGENTYRIIVEDNGPGIKKENVPYVFGKLLFGSKFMKLAQTRGQQGIGISGAVLYSQLTTGKPVKIYSKIGDGNVHVFELGINIETNEPDVLYHETLPGNGHGIRIEMYAKGKYVRGKQSVEEYLKQTAIMNPHAHIIFVDPDGNETIYERGMERLPKKPKEIKPHPYGIELGYLMRMLSNTKSKSLLNFLVSDFSRIGEKIAKEIIFKAGLDTKQKPQNITRIEAEKLLKAMQSIKIPSPPTDCLSPVGEEAIKQGLKKELLPEFVTSISRKPKVYRGFPFLVEVGIAYGGNISLEQAKLYRFANKVPLLYEQGACALTRAFQEIDWKRYGVRQQSNGFPEAPMIVAINFSSVWVPYTSESKEAISHYDEIIKEVKLAIQDAARDLQRYLSKVHKAKQSQERKSKFLRYVSEIADALSVLTGKRKEEIEQNMNRLVSIFVKDYAHEIVRMQDKDYLRFSTQQESSKEENVQQEEKDDYKSQNNRDLQDNLKIEISSNKELEEEFEIDSLINEIKSKAHQKKLIEYGDNNER